jgi:hypothetical protein
MHYLSYIVLRYPVAHIQNVWMIVQAALDQFDMFGIFIMLRETEIGKSISKLSSFGLCESPSYFYKNVNNVR